MMVNQYKFDGCRNCKAEDVDIVGQDNLSCYSGFIDSEFYSASDIDPLLADANAVSERQLRNCGCPFDPEVEKCEECKAASRIIAATDEIETGC